MNARSQMVLTMRSTTCLPATYQPISLERPAYEPPRASKWLISILTQKEVNRQALCEMAEVSYQHINDVLRDVEGKRLYKKYYIQPFAQRALKNYLLYVKESVRKLAAYERLPEQAHRELRQLVPLFRLNKLIPSTERPYMANRILYRVRNKARINQHDYQFLLKRLVELTNTWHPELI